MIVIFVENRMTLATMSVRLQICVLHTEPSKHNLLQATFLNIMTVHELWGICNVLMFDWTIDVTERYKRNFEF